MGYKTSIIEEQDDRLRESVLQTLRFAHASRFIRIENSEPSGHLYELPHVVKASELSCIILQEKTREPLGCLRIFSSKLTYQKVEYEESSLMLQINEGLGWVR